MLFVGDVAEPCSEMTPGASLVAGLALGGRWGGGKAVIHVSCARVPPRRGSGTQARSGHT